MELFVPIQTISYETSVIHSELHTGVSKNRGTPKWMVYKENPIKMDDLGVPPFSETSILYHTVDKRNPAPVGR